MDVEAICEYGRAVIDTETTMISRLSSRIDQNFANACRYLYNCQGRIVVMGVGKSGQIGKKIAATLSSTGSPSYFVHPSEAKHGDIGVMVPSDVVIMLSNSGESDELLGLLPSVKRLGIPLITLTGKPHSTLAQAATVNLDVSVEKEACPLGLAPTASTTAALVMGDALAMSLLSMRGFTQEDFARSHPGGSLGRRLLLRVDEIMHRAEAMPLVSHLASLKQALVEITQKKLGMTVIAGDAGELVGIFTDGDVRRALDKNVDIHQTPMRDIMTKNPKTIAGHLLAADALDTMETHQITSLVILGEHNKPEGVIHIHDILRARVSTWK
jgi:arabinose-5-phosphate isomerase